MQNIFESDYAEDVLINRKITGPMCLVAGYISLI